MIPCRRGVRGLSFTPDGNTLLATCWDGAEHGLDLSPSRWTVEDLGALAEFIACRKLGSMGSVVPLSAAEQRSAGGRVVDMLNRPDAPEGIEEVISDSSK